MGGGGPGAGQPAVAPAVLPAVPPAVVPAVVPGADEGAGVEAPEQQQEVADGAGGGVDADGYAGFYAEAGVGDGAEGVAAAGAGAAAGGSGDRDAAQHEAAAGQEDDSSSHASLHNSGVEGEGPSGVNGGDGEDGGEMPDEAPGPLAAAGLSLSSLTLDSCFVLSYSELVSSLRGLPLRALSLHHALSVGDEELVDLTRLTGLSSLGLYNCSRVAVSTRQDLKWLWLTVTHITFFGGLGLCGVGLALCGWNVGCVLS